MSTTNTMIQWAALAPLLIVLGAAVIATLLEAFLPRKLRPIVQRPFFLLALIAALAAIIWRGTVANQQEVWATTPLSITQSGSGFTGIAFVEDSFSLIAQAIIVLITLLAGLVMLDRTELKESAFAADAATTPGSPAEAEASKYGLRQTEVLPLVLFAAGGMMAFVSAFDLLSLFIALEVMSLPLYVLSATARRRRLLSQEAAAKYFLLGAFSSAIFLMGAALVYGGTGSLIFNEILSVALQTTDIKTWLLLAGTVMILVGLLFKAGAAPFHSWKPDVYQGAPTPITGFMAAGVLVAAFVALLRVMLYIAGTLVAQLTIFLWIIIIATILIGTILGLVQGDIKRLLAYSSIAHTGFILVAISVLDLKEITPQQYAQTSSAILFYLLAYGLATVGAFGIVTLVRQKDAAGNIGGEATALASWAGLGKRSPLLAAAMTIFLLSFAGIPLTAGFIGKFEVFKAGVAGGATILVVIAVLASVATAFFYFRILQLMFFTEPAENVQIVKSAGFSIAAIVAAAILVLGLGIFPDLLLGIVQGTFA
ncbi:NADH-quinone oxidoreductase subunit NuoN [Arcanobacterium urinimassiliense]|uniref:NADH-quinone oxidoreductase subunit NuoN n=1 Tax=Arcanobacterium urinimassiliense TaxID=1871014 RepID=UPI0009389BA2